MKTIELSIPLSSEAMISARLVASAIAASLGMDFDSAEDVKLLAGEGCNIMIAENFSNCRITFEYESGILMKFCGINRTSNDKIDTKLNKLLIEGLSKNVDYEFSDGRICGLVIKA